MVTSQRTVETPLGPITYTLTVKSVKNMNLRVHGDGAVALSMNRRMSYTAADAFVRSRAEWIGRGREKLAQGTQPLVPPDQAEAVAVLSRALDRVLPLVEPLGVKRPALQVRYMTSRWGSCHWGKGKIVLNSALASADVALQDYVALHEQIGRAHV